GLDLDQAERQPLALLGERTCGRRQPFALLERPSERGRTRLGEPRLLGERLVSLNDDRLAQPLGELRRALPPELEPLAGAAQPVESGRRPLATAGEGGELILRARPLAEERLERCVERLPLRRRRLAPRLRRAGAVGKRRQVERGERGSVARDLAGELLRSLGGRRLE